MRVKLTYTGSSGNIYNLQADGLLRVKSANFHNYEWKASVTAQQYGATVDRFQRDPITYATSLMFMGNYEDNKALIETLHEEFENDIMHMSPGTLTWGDYSIQTYVISSSTYPNEPWTQNDVKFYCPYPFWVKEKTIRIFPYSPHVLASDKQYDAANGRYGYPYSYAGSQNRAVFLKSSNLVPCDFKIVAYGPFSYASITINGGTHRVDYEVSEGEYMVIDSRRYGRYKGRAYVVSSGVETNVFDHRDPQYELFAKVPAGDIIIDYARTYGIDVTFYFERSEPKWTLS